MCSYHVIARNRSDPSENGRSAGDLGYPEPFPCFGVSAEKRRHERDLRPRVERRSLCHKKSDEREQQTKACRAQTRQGELRFLPGTRFIFELPKCPFTPTPTVTICAGCVDAKTRAAAWLRAFRQTNLSVSYRTGRSGS